MFPPKAFSKIFRTKSLFQLFTSYQKSLLKVNSKDTTQLTFTCLKSIIETLQKGVKCVQSLQ